MAYVCDLQIQINGEETFFLNSDLLHRSALLLRLVRTSCKADRTSSVAGLPDPVLIALDNVPGGPEAFELATRFCYSNGDIVITSANVARLRCIAEVLDMTEEQGKANLLRRTESFLKNVVVMSWHESVTVLRSCESLLSFPESAPLVQRCVESLATKIVEASAAFGAGSGGPGNTSPTASHKSFDSHRMSTASDSSFGSLAPKKYWWFQDLCSLPVYVVEKVVKVLAAYRVDHKLLSRFLLHYIRKSLPVLGCNSVSPLVAFSGSLCPSPKKKTPTEELPMMPSYSQGVQCDILEIVVSLLSSLEEGSTSCKTLFGLLRVAFVLDANDACRKQLELKIGSQLDAATLDNILVPTLPPRNCAPLYDVDLVLRLVDCFLKDREALLEASMLAAEKKQEHGFLAWLFDTHKDGSRMLDENIGPFGVQKALYAVGDLLDKYLSEIAADVHLKAAKFEALAGALPDFARCSHDGLYRAIDIYLEAHPNVDESEAVSLCGVLNYQKLSMDTCKHLTKNKTFPPCVSLQVLLAQQIQLRSAVAAVYTRKKKKAARSNSGGLVGKIFDSGNFLADGGAESTNMRDVCQQNDDLRLNLRQVQSRVDELEKLCKRMRLEMAKHTKARRRLIC